MTIGVLDNYVFDLYLSDSFSNLSNEHIENLIQACPADKQAEYRAYYQEIQKQRISLDKVAETITVARSNYSRQINQYLTENPPFQYSQEALNASHKNQELADKLFQIEESFYWKLIKYSMICGDLDLLTRWGVNYPFGQGIETMYEKEVLEEYLESLFSNPNFVNTLGKNAFPFLSHLLNTLRGF